MYLVPWVLRVWLLFLRKTQLSSSKILQGRPTCETDLQEAPLVSCGASSLKYTLKTAHCPLKGSLNVLKEQKQTCTSAAGWRAQQSSGNNENGWNCLGVILILHFFFWSSYFGGYGLYIRPYLVLSSMYLLSQTSTTSTVQIAVLDVLPSPTPAVQSPWQLLFKEEKVFIILMHYKHTLIENKEKGFILAHGFGGFSPWSAGSKAQWKKAARFMEAGRKRSWKEPEGKGPGTRDSP